MCAVKRHKAEKFRMEVEFDFSNWPMAVLCDDKFGNVGWFKIGFVLVIVVNAMEKGDKVGVLLDGAGLAKVGENWARIFATRDGTGKLGESDDWDFELACESF